MPLSSSVRRGINLYDVVFVKLTEAKNKQAARVGGGGITTLRRGLENSKNLPAHLIDMAAFYAAVANEGRRPAPYGIESIEQNAGCLYPQARVQMARLG
jgi:membrane carboxypeptidase/penicillin-binding protein